LRNRRIALLAALLALVVCAPASALTVTTIPVGSNPVRAVVLGRSVWVLRETDGMRLLQRVDIATNRMAGATVPVATTDPYASPFCCQSVHPLVAAYGALWTTDWTTNEVVRIDPATGAPVARIDVGGQLVDVAVGPLGLWAAVACLPPPAGSSLPCGGRALVRIDPQSNAAAERIVFDPGLHDAPVALAVGRGRFWYAAPSSGLRLVELDPTGAVGYLAAGAWVRSAGRGALWSASRYGCELWRIPATGAPIELSEALLPLAGHTSYGGEPTCFKRGITQAGDGTLWIVGVSSRARTTLLLHLDPRRNRPLGKLLRLGRDPAWVTAGAGAVWVVNGGDGTLSRIDP